MSAPPNDTKLPQGPAQPEGPNTFNAQSSHRAPPPYNTFYSQQYPQIQPYAAVQEHTVLVYRPSPLRRFLRAFVWAFFTWALLAIFMRTFVDMVYWRHHHHYPHHRGGGGRVSSLPEDRHNLPIPSDVELDQCVSNTGWTQSATALGETKHWRSFPFASETSFDLPLDATTLSLIARGPSSYGNANIVTSPDQKQGVVTYRVVVHYYHEYIRDSAEVCSLSRQGGEKGVGIFTPPWPHRRRSREDMLYFETYVILPEPEGDTPLSIKNFVTDVPNTSHTVSDLASKILFDKIRLQGTNMPIDVASLAAISGSIFTENSMIKGVFNTTKSLTLITSNSPIDAHVGLRSDKDGSKPDLFAETSNSRLDLAISLFTDSESGTGGSFNVNGKTINSPLRIFFPTAPVDSVLTLTASTQNSPATVVLHPTYEGSLSLGTTTWFSADVHWDGQAEDPSGKERRREVDVSSRKRSLFEGSVHWVGGSGKKRDPATEGKVTVMTSNSPVTVVL